MKTKICIAVLLLMVNVSLSQDYLEEIALKSCECISSVSDTLDVDRYTLQAGLCMIETARPYKKQLKKDHGIDFNNIDKDGEELGRIIAFIMASLCPDALLKMVNVVNNQENSESLERIVEGEITNISDDKFVEFSVKENKGKVSRYQWLTFIESTLELSTGYKKLINSDVRITYIVQEFFDPRIGEYRSFNIIQKLEIIKP